MPSIPMSAEQPLLAVENLSVRFKLPQGWVTAVDNVGFDIRPGEIVGIVGESGSGKSQILLSVMGLLAGNGRASGSVRFRGTELLNRPMAELDHIRGSAMSMIFQDPMTSLNPYMRVSRQLTEVLTHHQGMSETAALKAATEMLERVRIPDARRRINLFPHEFSGGMRQRVMIAMALLCKPALLLADEPTTALDVTVQAQILELMAELGRDLGTAVAIVTHDLGVIARLCDRVIALYGGRIMEEGRIDDIFHDTRHPYTEGLLAATPRLDAATQGELLTIPGQPRAAMGDLPGCPFAPRCALRTDICTAGTPPLQLGSAGHRLACHKREVRA
jgi:oligopeptide transport system ATP-binding protein